MAGFSYACIFPINGIIAQQFLLINVVLALLVAYYFRLVIFFRQIFYLKFLVIQVFLFFTNPLLFFKAIGKMQEMLYLFDSHDLYYFISPDSKASAYGMNEAYHLYRNEFLLFSVGLLILLSLSEMRIVLAFVERIKKME